MISGLSAPAQSGSAAQQAAVPRIPFIRATVRHSEPAFDSTVTVAASSQQLGPFDVPAHGFIRAITLLVTASGGALGGGTINADNPWGFISEVTLTDTNGYPIVSPITGYQLYLANLFGGYRGNNDPTAHPNYASGAADLNPTFMLRIPVEITPWDGFGSLSNQNQSAPFRVRITINNTAGIVTGGAPTMPAVRVRGYLEAYSPPAAADLIGQPQETAPPGHGATQFWSATTPTVSAGAQQVRLPRVGNLIRNLIFVSRASGVRSAAVEPDDLTLTWDSRQVFASHINQVHRRDIYEAFGVAPPTGVLVLPFTDDQDGTAGYESRHLWLPTVDSTRLEVSGTFGAGTFEILTNDVSVTALGR
jgi:hypothetical protein